MSISTSRDRLNKNEVVITSQERDPIDESARQLTTQVRMSLGVFGGFDVSVQSQVPNHEYGSL